MSFQNRKLLITRVVSTISKSSCRKRLQLSTSLKVQRVWNRWGMSCECLKLTWENVRKNASTSTGWWEITFGWLRLLQQTRPATRNVQQGQTKCINSFSSSFDRKKRNLTLSFNLSKSNSKRYKQAISQANDKAPQFSSSTKVRKIKRCLPLRK